MFFLLTAFSFTLPFFCTCLYIFPNYLFSLSFYALGVFAYSSGISPMGHHTPCWWCIILVCRIELEGVHGRS
jgi:hypothetical protein